MEDDNYLDLMDVIVNLYEHELNAGITTFWDSEFKVFLGDYEGNGIKAEEFFDQSSLFKAGNWLDAKAKEIYPLYQSLLTEDKTL